MTFHDTTTREHGIARALDSLGHGDHGGFFESPRGIHCQCEAALTGEVEQALEAMRLERVRAALGQLRAAS